MGLQKYRADYAGMSDPGGAVAWYTVGVSPSLALIRNCPTPFGPRTVYIRGEADPMFTIRAACIYRGKAVRGYLVRENYKWQFRVTNPS